MFSLMADLPILFLRIAPQGRCRGELRVVEDILIYSLLANIRVQLQKLDLVT